MSTTNNAETQKAQKGTEYRVVGRYNKYYVDRYINGQMNGTVVYGTTKKNAIEMANALTSAYSAGMRDAAQFIKEQYEKDNQQHVDNWYKII